ncbi:MAG: DUF4097 family beta strand repeat-containing protein [Flavobacteriales bacterium]|nr:DUF4097 family beta strand repeat-containing protein [Flavobacteriales bacterium]
MTRIILFIINCLLFANILANTKDDFEDSKTIKKVVKSSEDFELEIENKHGNIKIENWDKDSVSVEVYIKVESSNLDRLSTILDNIDIDFNAFNDYLGVSTEWNDIGKGFKNDVLKLFGEQSVKVAYTIKAPDYISVDITNKYGNVSFGNFNGKIKLNVSHGDINLRTVSKLKSIKLKYGKLKAKKIEKGDIYARFAKIRIDEVDHVDFDCASSELEIEKADRVLIKSVSDDIEIEKANSVQINASFTDIEIEELNTLLKGNIKHGNLDVDLLNSAFTEVTLNGQSTDIELNFNEDVSFDYFVQLEKGEAFIIPSAGNKLKADNLFDHIHQYEGSFAKTNYKDNAPKIRVIAKNSYIQFDIE